MAPPRYAAKKPTNWVTRISGPGVVSAKPRPSSISPGSSHLEVLDALLGNVGQYGIGAAERVTVAILGEVHGKTLSEHVVRSRVAPNKLKTVSAQRRGKPVRPFWCLVESPFPQCWFPVVQCRGYPAPLCFATA